MEKLIPIINQLQDVFSAVGTAPIDLPQIVAVGSQSSGKSSVIENIVGRDFLPRGTGICTRRPLILQLVHVEREEEKESDRDEWGEFLHMENEKIYDFNKIREEIVRETEKITGGKKTISPKPINLKIYSPEVLNLTMVDLPGITKVAVGDQPEDIGLQIKEMVLHYISNPNSIILAISAANSDLATSDALQIAREVDPYGLRTLGVLTKIDLMDQGCTALDVLHGKVIPLKLGFVGVKNRSQMDIKNNVPIKRAVESEKQFFAKHPAYRSISSRMGTEYLATCLSRMLVQHIKETLPSIKTQINALITELQRELDQYGDPILSQKAGQGALVLHLLSKFCNNFCDAIDGRARDSCSTTELFGGARISYIFHGVYARGLGEIHPFDDLTDQDIRTAIRNATGPRPSLFVPEVSFEILVRTQIARLEEPSLQCVDLVFEELQRVAQQCETPEISRFSLLRDNLIDCVNALLRRHLQPAKTLVSNLISIELAYINTNHPDFIGGSKAVSTTVDSMQRNFDLSREGEEEKQSHPSSSSSSSAHHPSSSSSSRVKGQKQSSSHHDHYSRPNGKALPNNSSGGPRSDREKGLFGIFGNNRHDKSHPMSEAEKTAGRWSRPLGKMPHSVELQVATDREHIETQIIKKLISSYYGIVKKNILDSVPKAVMHLLVNQTKTDLQSELVSALYKKEKFSSLLEENSDIAQKRSQCLELLTILNRALEIVNNVRDFKI